MVITRIHIVSMVLLAVMGVVVLAFSLMAANRLNTIGFYPLSGGWRVYFSDTILPDHLAYPVLRVRDRMLLETSEPMQQVDLKLRFAEHRYGVAEHLLEKNQDELAITTLSKSQKYVISAGYQILEMESLPVEQASKVRAALDHSIYRLDQFSKDYDGLNHEIFSQLHDDSMILLQRLDEKLNTTQN